MTYHISLTSNYIMFKHSVKTTRETNKFRLSKCQSFVYARFRVTVFSAPSEFSSEKSASRNFETTVLTVSRYTLLPNFFSIPYGAEINRDKHNRARALLASSRYIQKIHIKTYIKRDTNAEILLSFSSAVVRNA